MGQVKQYSREYKEEAIKLAKEKGCKNAATAMYPSLKKNCSSFAVRTRNRQRKSNGFKRKIIFYRKQPLFSQRAIRSVQKRKNEIHCYENQRWSKAWKNCFLLQSA